MLSNRTLLQLNELILGLTSPEIDTLLITFNLQIPQPVNGQVPSKRTKTNMIYQYVKENSGSPGPFNNNIQIDLLQYFVDRFYDRNPEGNNAHLNNTGVFDFDDDDVQVNVPYTELFVSKHPVLTNLLRLDGFIIEGRLIKKLLSEELVESNTESELEALLLKYNMNVPLGHLGQGIDNYRDGQWAAANAQFRAFFESLVMEVSRKVIPGRNANNYNQAYQNLSDPNILNNPFFSTHLNEVQHPNCDKPFIGGLWKRLHPQGAHPGLSDREDCTFRYHTCIVFAHYVMGRLQSRIGQ